MGGGGCQKCLNKQQSILFEKIKKHFVSELIKYEYKTAWIGRQSFDIYFPDYDLAIEYNGEQHYMPIKRFGGEPKLIRTQKLDFEKAKKCIKNNCKLFVVKYGYSEKEFNILLNKIELYIKNKKNFKS